MPEAISPELQRKLKLIEAETEFFSKGPAEPKLSKVYVGFSIFALLIGLVAAIRSGELSVLIGLGLLFSLNVLFYFFAKKQYEMYMSACELIRYYKAASEDET